VIRAAKSTLAMLEADSVRHNPQADLFAVPDSPPGTGQPHPVLQTLSIINPDELSPKAAHELLYELKRKADQQD
jgi:DNA mismatch repair protein MutS